MSNLEVRIIQLEPMRVASFHAFGPSPENDAWNKLAAWAKPKGWLADLKTHRVFGFNNPDPSPGSPNYGYEFWMDVGPDFKPEGGVALKEFAGGLYAVTRCEVRGGPGEQIPAAWKQLVLWREDSPYKHAAHQCLEQHVSVADMPNEFVLDLYLPIAN